MITCENYNIQFSRHLLKMEESLLESEIEFLKLKTQGILTENTEFFLLAEEQKKTSKTGFFKQLLNSLKELWGRFLENFKKMLSADSKWLEENTERLLKTNIKGMQYNMFPYWKGLQYMTALKIPQLNPNDAKLMEALKTKESYIEYLISGPLASVKKDIDTGDFAESLKSIFRGGEALLLEDREIAHNLKAMINYCKNADGITTAIVQDQKKIERAVNDAIKNANKADREQSTPQKSESYIIEADEQQTADKQKVSNGNAEGTKSKADVDKANAALNSATNKAKEKLDKQVDDTKKNLDDSNKEKNDFKGEISYSDKTDRYSVYATVSQSVLGAKMTIYEERYKAYMKLFMTIVKRNHNANAKNDEEKISFDREVINKVKEIINEKENKIPAKVKAKAKTILDKLLSKIKTLDKTTEGNEKKRVEKEIKDLEKQLQPFVDDYYGRLG